MILYSVHWQEEWSRDTCREAGKLQTRKHDESERPWKQNCEQKKNMRPRFVAGRSKHASISPHEYIVHTMLSAVHSLQCNVQCMLFREHGISIVLLRIAWRTKDIYIQSPQDGVLAASLNVTVYVRRDFSTDKCGRNKRNKQILQSKSRKVYINYEICTENVT